MVKDLADAPIDRALSRLAEDGLVAYPTETVWGLAARATREEAVARLRSWKGRAASQPISILVAEVGELADDFDLTPAARALVRAFWPGPLTLVLSCRRRFAPGIAREDGAVGLRYSPHPVAIALARDALARGLGPLTATSLNRAGAPPARTLAEARVLCGEDDAPRLLAVAEHDAYGEPPSTVVDATGSEPRILRVGAIPRDAIEAALSERAEVSS